MERSETFITTLKIKSLSNVIYINNAVNGSLSTVLSFVSGHLLLSCILLIRNRFFKHSSFGLVLF